MEAPGENFVFAAFPPGLGFLSRMVPGSSLVDDDLITPVGSGLDGEVDFWEMFGIAEG